MEAALQKTEWSMPAPVAHTIWNYISGLGVDHETAHDLYQEAEIAVWKAATHRAYNGKHRYLVITGIGAIKHWLRDRYSLIRIPGYLHDRGEASYHRMTMVPLESTNPQTGESREMHPALGVSFEGDLLEDINHAARLEQVKALLPRLTEAEQAVMEELLAGKTIKQIAAEREVHISCVYTQRTKTIAKLQSMLLAEEADVA